VKALLTSVAAAIAALLLSAFVLMLFGVGPAATATLFVQGAFGSPAAWSETLLKAIPLIMTSLAVLMAFRAGVWNIGAEGQFVAGALAALMTSAALPEGPVALAAALVAGAVAGAAWAAVAAILRATRNVPEVLSTILMNFIALHLLGYAVNGPLQQSDRQYPQSDPVAAATWLPQIGELRLHAGGILAIAAAIVLAWALSRTMYGLRLRATGSNPSAAAYAGVDVRRTIFKAFLLSGALAGAGGAIELLGVTHRLFERFAAGYGYSGITAALLGGLDPLGAVAASLFVAALRTGGGELQRGAGVSASGTLLTEGVVILVLVAMSRVHLRRRAIRAAGEERA
jgi:ABC-type uncharacterized transport system permease subunit